MAATIRLLILEDEPLDAELEIATLEEVGYVCQWKRVETRAEFLACLDTPDYDIILADYNLPTFDGLAALHLFLEHDLDLPFIFVSGTMGEETAIESLKAGATDYVLKERLARLGPAVKRALHEREDRRQRKQAEEALQKSQQLLNAIVDHSPAAIQVKDLQGRYLLVNSQIETIFDLQRHEIIDKTPHDILAPEIAASFLANDQAALQARSAVRTEEIVPFPDGMHTFVALKFPLMDDTGEPYAVAGVSTDITERKRVEESLRRERDLTSRIAETSPVGIVMVNREGQVTFANPRAEHILGLAKDAITQRAYNDPEWRITAYDGSPFPDEQLPFQQVTATGQPVYDVRHAIEWPDGHRVLLSINAAPLLDETGQVDSMVATVHDVTEQVQAEETLQESERRFRNIIESTPLGMHMYRLEPDGRLIFTGANPAADRILGIDNSQFVEKTIEEAFPGLTETEVPEAYRRVASTGQSWKTDQITYEEGQISGAFEVYAFQTSPGNMAAAFLDITDRKRAEEALRESEERFRALVQNSSDIIVVMESAGSVRYVSSAVERILGYSADRFLTDDPFDYVHPDDVQMVQEKLAQAIQTPSTPISAEFRLKHRDGSWVSIEMITNSLLDKPEVRGIVINTRDITKRKRAEEALRENEELLDSILTASAVGIAYARDREIIWANDAMAKLFGFTEEGQYVGKDTKMLYASEEEYGRIGEIAYEQQRSGKVIEFDAEFRRQDGSLFDGHVKINTLDPLSPRRGIIVSIIDITKRKRAEEAVKKSQESLTRTQSIAHLGGWEWDLVAQETTWSDENYRISGYEPGDWEPTFEKFMETVHPDDRDMIMQKLSDIQEGKITHDTYEYRIVLPDGTERWLEGHLDVIFGDAGQPAVLAGTNLDITERKRNEKERERLLAEIQEQAQRVQQIIDTVPEGVILLDTDSRIILANPLGREDLTILADTLVGGILTRLGDRQLPKVLTSPPQGLWHEVTAKERVFQVIARPIEIGPIPRGWVLVIHEVTQQREIEQRIQQQERLAAVGQLAAGIAHDFNNIMAVISLYAGMSLRTADLPTKFCDRLETIDQQARRASDLIQQILDFSRRAVLERQPMELMAFLKEQVKLLERTLPENIRVDMEIGEDEYIVNADPTRVQQAIMNLATNARDAMPEGGQLRINLAKIQITERKDAPLPDMEPGEWVCVTVADTGTGISPDVLPHIYDPFFTTKPVGLGTGLGLSQVYGIVKQHEGHIDVTTQEGEGTTFVLYLPAIAPQRPKPSHYETEMLIQGQGQTILVVEDDNATRAALTDSLELLDYRVLETTNGQEALSILEQYASRSPTDPEPEIELVLSDVVMPGMGGRALFHALKERNLTVKVVLLTGHPLDEGELEGLRSQGLGGWLLKPLSIERLSQVVAEALEQE